VPTGSPAWKKGSGKRGQDRIILQAACLLTEALAFPGQRKTATKAAKAAAKPRVIIPITQVPMTA